jgi:hypothetical protein
MFDKQKAELVANKIQKYAGKAVCVHTACINGKWIVNVEALEDNFNLEFKGIEIKFTRRRDGNNI